YASFLLSVRPQYDDRIDLAGATCRQPHRQERDRRQQDGDAGEDHRIPGRHAEQKRRDEPGEPERPPRPSATPTSASPIGKIAGFVVWRAHKLWPVWATIREALHGT